MSTIVPIPGGEATIRDVKDLRVKHRRLIEAATIGAASALSRLPQDLAGDGEDLTEVPIEAMTNLTAKDATALMELQDATIVALLQDWTLRDERGVPVPLPTMETVGDLSPEVYDALAQATRTAAADLGRAADLGPSPDPKAPTDGSPPSSAG